MGLNIKSEEVHRLAHQLAARTGTSMTQAIRDALVDRLAQLDRAEEKEAVLRRVEEIIRRSGPTPPGLTSDHRNLYDDQGLPV